jgi:CheY-like chemotaxis protein
MNTEQGKKLLGVEDDDSTREWLALVLRQHGYAVALARNGREALHYLDSGFVPDLILLDMLMPVVDGWHFLQQVQRKALSPPVPILVITASTVIGQEWVQAHGCAGVLRKPLDPVEMLREVRRCLQPWVQGARRTACSA